MMFDQTLEFKHNVCTTFMTYSIYVLYCKLKVRLSSSINIHIFVLMVKYVTITHYIPSDI